jgi:Zn ribbon nucleic-acid-binding protein
MDFDNNEKITRRKFVKGVAGAAVCCTCISLDSLAAL